MWSECWECIRSSILNVCITVSFSCIALEMKDELTESTVAIVRSGFKQKYWMSDGN